MLCSIFGCSRAAATLSKRFAQREGIRWGCLYRGGTNDTPRTERSRREALLRAMRLLKEAQAAADQYVSTEPLTERSEPFQVTGESLEAFRELDKATAAYHEALAAFEEHLRP